MRIRNITLRYTMHIVTILSLATAAVAVSGCITK